MPRLSKSDLNAVTRGTTYNQRDFLLKRFAEDTSQSTYDIFLSHSYLDKDTILQLNYLLEEVFGFSVYVDWIENPGLDRQNVTAETAEELKSAMDRSETLIYAISSKSSSSKWMPWELGYSDARHGRVAVLPIDDVEQTVVAYNHQEFVFIYPIADYAEGPAKKKFFWVNDQTDPTRYISLDKWIKWKRGEPLPKH